MLFNPHLPSEITYAELDVFAASNVQLTLLKEEQALLQTSTSKIRYTEFARGRTAARSALEKLGLPASPVLRLQGTRLPAWPKNIVGSISHCERCVVAVAAKQKHILALGVDVETIRPIRSGLLKKIATTAEREWAIENIDILTLFSAKESLYKAVFPLVKEHLGFQDVEFRRLSPSSQTTYSLHGTFLRPYGKFFNQGSEFLIQCIINNTSPVQNSGALLTICYIIKGT